MCVYMRVWLYSLPAHFWKFLPTEEHLPCSRRPVIKAQKRQMRYSCKTLLTIPLLSLSDGVSHN